jgi:hypothetical protein
MTTSVKKTVLKRPPALCEVCKQPIKGVFYDFRMRGGMWANGCERCFKLRGIGLGTGLGQKYQQQEGSAYWPKVAG